MLPTVPSAKTAPAVVPTPSLADRRITQGPTAASRSVGTANRRRIEASAASVSDQGARRRSRGCARKTASV
jgi:hypothetical protein